MNVDVEPNGGIILVKGVDFGEHNITETDMYPKGHVHNITDVLNFEED